MTYKTHLIKTFHEVTKDPIMYCGKKINGDHFLEYKSKPDPFGNEHIGAMNQILHAKCKTCRRLCEDHYKKTGQLLFWVE